MPNYTSKDRYPTAAAIREVFTADQHSWFKRATAPMTDLSEDQVRQLDCMFGADSSTCELLGSNGVERNEIMQSLATALNEHVALTGESFATVTIENVDWCAPCATPDFDLVAIRLASTVLKKLGNSSIGVIQIGCLPVDGDPDRMNFHAYVRGLVFGPNIQDTVPIAASSLQKRVRAPAHAISPIAISYPRVVNERTVTAAAANLLDLGDPYISVAKRLLGPKAAKRWLKFGRIRAHSRLRILSLCRLDRLMLATGSLEPVLASLRAGAQARVRKIYQRGEKTLHPDSVVHFWADQLLRVTNDEQRVPFVKHRK